MNNRTTFKHQRGIGMIEVLITLFILSIGLLGVASMQFVGSFSNADALSRTQAVMVAQQMSERLRASMTHSQITDGFVVDNEYYNPAHYNFSGLSCSGNNPFNCHCLARPASVPDCQGGQCTSAEIAEFDAYQISCAAVQSNPSATIALTCDDQIIGDGDDCSPGSVQTITVNWPSVGWQDANEVNNANCAANSDCVVLRVVL